MTNQEDNSRLLWMLGAVMTLPAILISGPFAGYLLGHFIFYKYFGMPAWGVPVFLAIGFFASGLQVVRLIKRIKDSDSKKN